MNNAVELALASGYAYTVVYLYELLYELVVGEVSVRSFQIRKGAWARKLKKRE